MKKLIFLFVIVFIIQTTATAQSCLPDGITFTTQAEIDNFQINYPNCTEIEGDVEIGGDDITNLNGLNALTSIGGGLKIRGNNTLTSLVGLDNVTFLGGYLDILDNHGLVSLTGLESLTSIEGYLGIGASPSHYNGNISLASLAGLNNLATVGGGLFIYANNSLINLTGLDNLISIGGLLRIASNDTLTSLTGLDSLAAVGGDLIISYNNILTSLTGLDNINAATINNLYIVGNSSLFACDVHSVCDYLVSPNGVVEIRYNATGCNNPPEIAIGCGTTLLCLPYGNYYFNNQAQIDNFQINYPNCTDIEGDVIIKWSDINNLNGLIALTSISGSLQIGDIWDDHNPYLISLSGLNNLSYIGDGLGIYRNSALTSLTGLENLNTIEGSLAIGHDITSWGPGGNPSLNNISALSNLSDLKGSLTIAENDLLTSLYGLHGLDSIGGYIWIEGNDTLSSLADLENLSVIGGSLAIIRSPELTNLTGLDNIDAGTISGLSINHNSSLSTCEVQSICSYLAAPNGDISIHDNGPGCNSPEEILDSCDFISVTEYEMVESISVHPNPFSTSTTIEYELAQPEYVQINIYNHLGKQVDVIQQSQQSGRQQVVWNAKGLPAGIYYFTIKAVGLLNSGKMILMK